MRLELFHETRVWRPTRALASNLDADRIYRTQDHCCKNTRSNAVQTSKWRAELSPAHVPVTKPLDHVRLSFAISGCAHFEAKTREMGCWTWRRLSSPTAALSVLDVRNMNHGRHVSSRNTWRKCKNVACNFTEIQIHKGRFDWPMLLSPRRDSNKHAWQNNTSHVRTINNLQCCFQALEIRSKIVLRPSLRPRICRSSCLSCSSSWTTACRGSFSVSEFVSKTRRTPVCARARKILDRKKLWFVRSMAFFKKAILKRFLDETESVVRVPSLWRAN